MRLLSIRTLCASALFSVAIVVAFLPGSYLQPQRYELELELVSGVPGTVQVFFSDGSGFHEAASSRAPIPAEDERATVRLPILPGRWTEFRLDPIERSGRIAITGARVVLRGNETERVLPLASFVPIHHITGVELRDGALELAIPADRNDPQLAFPLEPPLEVPPPWRQFVMAFWLPAIGVFVAVLGLLAAIDRRGKVSGALASSSRRRIQLGLAAGFFLVAWGARVAVIDRFGSDLPYWDQWWKEGLEILIPWADHGELWRNLVSPHNEHRIIPTLALNIGLLVLGGQWDARVQCVVNAVLPALLLSALLLVAGRRLTRGWALGVGLMALMLTAVPLAWENIIGGFQSQFSFLIGFSLVAMGGLLGWRACSRRWWLAVAAGGVSLVSMGSGFFWALPVGAIALLRFRRGEINRREAALTIGVAATFVIVGWLLRGTQPSHDVLHAQTIGQLLRYAVNCLAWPLPQVPAFAALTWAPWVLLAGLRLAGAPALDRRTADFVLATGAWVLLQAIAVAYARGASPGLPASRYGDVFALGPIAGFAALAAMAPCWRRAQLAGLGFAGLLVAATAVAGVDAWTRVTARSAELVSFERTVRDFVRSDDYATFAERPIPFPSPEELARALRHPAIRAVLPSSVRPPIALPGFEPGRPPEPSLEHRGTRFVAAPGRWESAPLPTGPGWWKFETCGFPNEPGVALELVAAADRRVLARIAPSKPPGESWRAAYVRAPSAPARLVARAEPVGKWIAFSEPIEMPTLSYRVWHIARFGLLILCLGLAATMALLIVEPLAVDPREVQARTVGPSQPTEART